MEKMEGQFERMKLAEEEKNVSSGMSVHGPTETGGPTKTGDLMETGGQMETGDQMETGKKDKRKRYRYEIARLCSFTNWPVTFLAPERLAAAGLYYLGREYNHQTYRTIDTVRCFECQIEICQWELGDDPHEDHAYWSEHCRFMRGLECGNVPIEKCGSVEEIPETKEEEDDPSWCEDVTGPGELPYTSCGCGCEVGNAGPEIPSRDYTAEESKSEETLKNGTVEGEEGEKRKSTPLLLCKLCYNAELEVVFVPCGHMVSCRGCATEMKRCPICRMGVTRWIRAFLS